MRAGAAEATGPWTQKTAPSVGWGGSFLRDFMVAWRLSSSALRPERQARVFAAGFLAFLAMCFLCFAFIGSLAGAMLSVAAGAARAGRSRRVGLGDRGERRENDRGADPDGGQCLQHFTFSCCCSTLGRWRARACAPSDELAMNIAWRELGRTRHGFDAVEARPYEP